MEFHCAVRVGSLGKGANCVGRCAYITAERMTDEATGRSFNHTSKEEVVYSQTFLPEHAPQEWLENPVEMWSSLQNCEMSSKATNPRLYREMEIAFPNEWSLEQEKRVLENICNNLADEGICCTAGLHNKENNHHVHIQMSMRRVDENGRWMAKYKKGYALDENGEKIPLLDRNGKQKTEKKTGRKLWLREEKSLCFDDKSYVDKWREMVCSEINKELSADRQLDHRSYEARGIKKTPTIHHFGLADRQAINEGIKAQNQRCEKLERDIEGLKNLIAFEEKRGTERSSQREQHTVPEQTSERDFSADIRAIRTSRTEQALSSLSSAMKGVKEGRALRLAEAERKEKEYEKQGLNAYDRDERANRHMGRYL